MVTIAEAQSDRELMGIFIEENMGLVNSVIKQMNRPVNEEYLQQGAIGLMKAIRYFKPEFGCKFSTYAVPMIMGEIQRYMRDYETNTITGAKVSRVIKDIYYRSIKLEHLEDSDICKELNITQSELDEARRAMQWHNSFDMELPESIAKDRGIILYDLFAANDNTEEEAIERLAKIDILDCLFDRLNERQAEVLYQYFQEKTQMEIAMVTGISQAQVSRILIRIIEIGKEIVEGRIKVEKKITREQLLSECRERGITETALKDIAEKYNMTVGSVKNKIYTFGINKILKQDNRKNIERINETKHEWHDQVVSDKPSNQPESISFLKIKAWGGKENTYSFEDGKLVISNLEGCGAVAVHDINTMIAELKELAAKAV